jgi:hypothetical protein
MRDVGSQSGKDEDSSIVGCDDLPIGSTNHSSIDNTSKKSFSTPQITPKCWYLSGKQRGVIPQDHALTL